MNITEVRLIITQDTETSNEVTELRIKGDSGETKTHTLTKEGLESLMGEVRALAIAVGQ